MYRRLDEERGGVSNEFVDGIHAFLSFARNQPSYRQRGNLLCPCSKCKNQKRRHTDIVEKHIYLKGFTENYYVWTHHGESCEASTSHCPVEQETWSDHQNSPVAVDHSYDPNEDVHMLFDDATIQENMVEPNFEERYHDSGFHAFEAVNQPLYEGCHDGISPLYLASKILNWKTTYNLAEACLDEISETFKTVLPSPNKAPESYYETKKLSRSLGLPCHKIDVCEDNCMLFWKGGDKELLQCRFCKKDRFLPYSGKGKRIPKQRMFYLPIGDRLKRLYQSETTSSHMRWHAEHVSPEGEMHHPSDGKAWKHFQKVYPQFAYESRNVYLGLSTDGFNPIGMNGQAHSVWPVILTPYNLPPGMCMKMEYFFLAILVPGPKHPKKSLDVFLQPLIEELQFLWSDGVDAYDVSRNQNFKMRVALMWTISDFPAYGMLSGWTTHGRLACPYCLEETKSFWLPNGRKHSWFDCHRVFLPKDHPYRRNLRAFRKGKSMHDDPPTWLSGEEILYERIRSIEGVFRTVDCGGKGHDNPARTITGYGDYHNWVKQSIFWDLPYWADLLLRHNLDFMHIEKKFFDNLIKTLLNVPGKTKDNVKSRMDLPSICRRPDLEVTPDGKAPVPKFRLSKDGLKSHDCHVIMQRLLPIAFLELLPEAIHTAISDVED
ncbi:PREDICTED: uncharacterized protein LOC104720554 [Camelina sativa]|uniref:Uncharacterized protein LOC104720554 n=1 Tax=Camelina sativa TaxID=90675 RepID=A0ABM0U6P3_CAMSA|nr:PREDICTED: uncharacterized protein LOC104720554 [Camelina sativa]